MSITKKELFSLLTVFSISSITIAAQFDVKYVDQTNKDNRGYLERTIDCIEAYLGEIPTSISTKYINTRYNYPNDCPSCLANPSGMLVMVHGLGSSPSQWHKYVTGLKDTLPYWSLFTPKVRDQGNCYLNEAVEPILKELFRWADSYPDLPIILMGTSNGGRIVLELMNQFRQGRPHDLRRMLLISISGVIGGSKTLEYCEKRLGIARFLKPEPIRIELMPGSQRIQKLHNDTAKNLKDTATDCLFISTPPEVEYLIGTSLYTAPDFGNKALYLMVRGAAHSGVVPASYPVIEQVINGWAEKGSIKDIALIEQNLLPSQGMNFPTGICLMLIFPKLLHWCWAKL